MSVVGYDFGNLNCYIAVARQGGIDVLTNDYSLHATPTCVSFGSKSRVMGVAARQQVNTNFRNTVMNFKHILGRKYSDPVVQLYKKFIPCEIVQQADDTIGLKINYLQETRILSPEQVTAALLTKLKTLTENALGTKINECVVSVPYYFSDNQRRALLTAGQIAGLNLLKIVNENTAVGIAYGIYKGSTFPPEKDPAKIVVFVDVGHSSTQASVMSFHERKVTILGSTHDITVGGLFFDDLIRDYFHKEFSEKYNIDAQKNPRAWLRLLDESEKVKKQMSANSTAIPLSIECFMDDKDVTGKMQRSQFEELAAPLFEKIRQMLYRLVEQTNIKVEDVSEVELIGGSSRIPFIKQMVANFFNREPKTTMNQDEAVARGSGMQCAIISPSFKVKEFNIRDSYLFDLKICYESINGMLQEQIIFKQQDEFPFSKILTVEKSSDFSVSAFYVNSNNLPYSNNFIGRWTIKNVTPTADDKPRKVRVKFRLNHNGIFFVPSASSVEIQQLSNEDVEMTESSNDVNATNAPPSENQTESEENSQTENANKKEQEDAKKTQEKVKTKKVVTEYVIEEDVPFSINLEECMFIEKEMQKIDLNEKLKADAKNAVEEYCYGMRDKLVEAFANLVTQQEIDQFQGLLMETEEWLYGDGEDADRLTYENKLEELRSVIETPIRDRQQKLEEKAEADAAAAAAVAAANENTSETMECEQEKKCDTTTV